MYIGFKFWKQNARKFYAVERVDLNPIDQPSPPSKKRWIQELHHDELDSIMNTLEVVEQKITEKLNSIFK